MGFWIWLIVPVAVCVVAILLVERRRGSHGASRGGDLPGNAPRPPMVNPADSIGGMGGFQGGGGGAGGG